MQREIRFPGSKEELEKIVREYARTFGGLIGRRPNAETITVILGGALASNPNEIRWTLRVALAGETLRAGAGVPALPWSRRRARRIVEARLDQFVDFVETRLRGGAIEKFSDSVSQRPFAPIGPGLPGACIAVASWAAQISVALVATTVVAVLLGLVLIDQQIGILQERGEALQGLEAVRLPSPGELESAGFGVRLGASIILMMPIVFLIGFGYGLVHAIGDVWSRAARLSIWVFAFFVLLLAFSLWSAVPVYLSIPFALAIPGTAHAALMGVWSLRRERRREPAAPDPAARRRSIAVAISCAIVRSR